MRVLIADDDPTSREIVRHLLLRAGHRVRAVADGGAARDALLREPFGAALLDLQMPVMDGGAVARAVRVALPAGRLPRLIALTAAADPGAEGRMLAHGFDACVGKPVRGAVLLAALQP